MNSEPTTPVLEVMRGDADLAQLQGENRQLMEDLARTRAVLHQLTFTVFHDLRAPLRHIGAFAKILEEDHSAQLAGAAAAHLKVIQDAALKAMKILDGLSSPAKP